MKLNKTLIGIIAAVVLIGGWAASAYNSMVSEQEKATTALANVQSTYQRRADLIPNLVEVVKGYATHESETLEAVTTARTNYVTAATAEARMDAANSITGALGRLFAVAESYPELKANLNFQQLQSDLTDTENKISYARMSFNDCSNTDLEKVFDLLLRTAVKNRVPREEMPAKLYIISDMEFDMAQKGWYGSDTILTESLFDSIKQKYIANGYNLPKLIFWNVNSRTQTIPLVENELGVVLVSGFSQNVLKMIMSNNCNPYEVLIETITSERYDQIICD